MHLYKILVLATLACSALFYAGCQDGAKKDGAGDKASQTEAAGMKVAYVNIDSLESHYELLKKRREDFKRKQEVMESELQQSYQQMQSKGEDMQRKAQTMTQSELQAAEKQLMLMQQSLESRKQSLTEQLVKEQEDLNKDLKHRLDSFLEAYNQDKHYDYILSYSSAGGSAIMYANKKYEITNEVIAGMNAISKIPDQKKK